MRQYVICAVYKYTIIHSFKFKIAILERVPFLLLYAGINVAENRSLSNLRNRDKLQITHWS